MRCNWWNFLFSKTEGSISFEAIWAGLFITAFFAPIAYLFEFSETHLDASWAQRTAAMNQAINGNCNGEFFIPVPIGGETGIHSLTVIACTTADGEKNLPASDKFWKKLDTESNVEFSNFTRDMKDKGDIVVHQGGSAVTYFRGLELGDSSSESFLAKAQRTLATSTPKTSSLLSPSTDYYIFDKAVWKEGHDKRIWDEFLRKHKKLFPNVYPSASSGSGGSSSGSGSSAPPSSSTSTPPSATASTSSGSGSGTGNTQVADGGANQVTGSSKGFSGGGGGNSAFPKLSSFLDRSTKGSTTAFNAQVPTPRVLGAATSQPLTSFSTNIPVCPPVGSSFETANSTAPFKATPNKNAAIPITDDDIRAEGRRLIEQRVVPHVNTDFGSGLAGAKNEINALYLQAASFDSKFHEGENNQQLFEFRGRTLTGSELNYYYQGLFYATYGSDLMGKAQMKTSIYAWKAVNYKELPSENTIWAANQGFEDGVDFQFKTTPKPSLQDTIDKFQQVEAGQCDYSSAAEISPDEPPTPQSSTVATNGVIGGNYNVGDYSYPIFSQADSDNSLLYSDAEWALADDTVETGIHSRTNYTCLATVYAMIEHARGNTSFRINGDTYTDKAGATGIEGVSANIDDFDLETIKNEIAKGNPIILNGSSDSLTAHGHWLVAVDITSSGKLIALDPYGGDVIEIDPETWTTDSPAAKGLKIERIRTVKL